MVISKPELLPRAMSRPMFLLQLGAVTLLPQEVIETVSIEIQRLS